MSFIKAVYKKIVSVTIYPLARIIFLFKNLNKVPLFWYDYSNWGDALNPWLVSMLSGREVVMTKEPYLRKYLVIGSTLGLANENVEVWGSGFIKENETLDVLPRKIHAVRGPLTRKALLDSGIPCPEVYGDPALLLPKFFNPDIPKIHNVGVIPHYIEKNHPWIVHLRDQPGVNVIDIDSGLEEVVRQVKSCRVIASSSLHGLICSDAYGVPNVWIKLTDNIIGGDFKFRDYRLSIGAPDPIPLVVTDNLSINEVMKHAVKYEVKLNLNDLMNACPFLERNNHIIN